MESGRRQLLTWSIFGVLLVLFLGIIWIIIRFSEPVTHPDY
jgi:hypothetical protein